MNISTTCILGRKPAFKILRYDEQKFIDILEDTTQDTKDLSI